MKLESLRELLIDELQDIYSAELQIIKALPKMAITAGHDALKQIFTEHLHETENQVHRLDLIFGILKRSPKGKDCEGMRGLLREAEDRIGDGGEPDVLDAGMIADAQRVEHYEIAAYGTARTYARLLGETECEGLLEETLREEKNADAKLNEVASSINIEAREAAGTRPSH